MLFTEARFFIFFVIVFALYWAIQHKRARIWVLTGASYVFYGAWDYRFLLLLFSVTAVSYLSSIAIERCGDEKTRTRIMVAGVTGLLSFLGVFKYFGFFTENFVLLAEKLGLSLSGPAIDILLPVGVSFYVFQAIGYVIDVKRRTVTASKSFLDVAFFVGFFPQLVAGPIVRAADFFPQIDVRHRVRDIPVKGVITVFLGGFIKKAVIADNIAPIFVDPVFADPSSYSSSAMMIAVFAYAVQIYCDFSGYSEMAIATSRAFGFRLPRNFDAPYFSSSIAQFWRRWHMSLSFWLRDYLYIALGGNRLGAFKTYRNLLITMLLGGLWHGASWNFVIWGGLHGAALAIERRFNIDKMVQLGRLRKVAGVFATFIFVCILWIFFRSNSFGDSIYILSSIITGRPDGISFGVFAYILMFAIGMLHYIVRSTNLQENVVSLPSVLFYALMGLTVALILPLLPVDVQPFIYFQF